MSIVKAYNNRLVQSQTLGEWVVCHEPEKRAYVAKSHGSLEDGKILVDKFTLGGNVFQLITDPQYVYKWDGTFKYNEGDIVYINKANKGLFEIKSRFFSESGTPMYSLWKMPDENSTNKKYVENLYAEDSISKFDDPSDIVIAQKTIPRQNIKFFPRDLVTKKDDQTVYIIEEVVIGGADIFYNGRAAGGMAPFHSKNEEINKIELYAAAKGEMRSQPMFWIGDKLTNLKEGKLYIVSSIDTSMTRKSFQSKWVYALDCMSNENEIGFRLFEDQVAKQFSAQQQFGEEVIVARKAQRDSIRFWPTDQVQCTLDFNLHFIKSIALKIVNNKLHFYFVLKYDPVPLEKDSICYKLVRKGVLHGKMPIILPGSVLTRNGENWIVISAEMSENSNMWFYYINNGKNSNVVNDSEIEVDHGFKIIDTKFGDDVVIAQKTVNRLKDLKINETVLCLQSGAWIKAVVQSVSEELGSVLVKFIEQPFKGLVATHPLQNIAKI